MTCERYWQDGILKVEQGEYDPHRDTCDECRRAHRERDRLVRALPRVGASTPGDPDWQTRVWSRIAREDTSRVRRSYWLGGGLAAACAIAVLLLYLGNHGPDRAEVARGRGQAALASAALAPGSPRPRIEIISGQVAMRSASARVGDRVRISAVPGGEVRIYRADLLVLRCPAWQRSPGCAPDLLGLVADAELATAGDYQVVLIPSVTAAPVGMLDGDLAAVIRAGGNYRIIGLSVR